MSDNKVCSNNGDEKPQDDLDDQNIGSQGYWVWLWALIFGIIAALLVVS